ncbi:MULTISPECIES: DUF6193 family natural product biosynthesis protein [Streptomyces]|uniref:Uncharacterized protein n=1 Tax=Streptomyces tsukubensis (strain DSM 42081 / NBRC 108919 / NRRL 18488 / 9993) TaxID=1114943 RepID=I2MYW4_STRT9|nr:MULTISPECIES: DUF6193 family natural product biosynthesis protein [Streptomyces]AZK94254.1 hypothetical protein B7R87_10545 [Streptomyces tsukubensis]EIF89961.1 hypothetical protein [Streptomyces tsukubensis NRRL18488]MYS66386.1 hypothetical protein [Streptomyces sp. SID5473]QKM69647.1 hypothetical protein STSU_023250 [Streptomyces tsukubensis NRRL18488]TAI46390.1 hypothetical protein EWI31_04905 [Streptomyces tsukubensis]
MTTDDTPAPTADEIVAGQWQWLLAAGPEHVRPDVVRAAYANPRLRGLFTGLSHGVLFFSLSTESPYTLVGGTVYYLENDRYFVRGAPVTSSLGETDSLKEAFALLAANIPDDAGPVVAGPGKRG